MPIENILEKALTGFKSFYLALSILPLCSNAQEIPAKPTKEQLKSYWFNGAEINRYELTQARYGSEHKGYAVLIYVTEDFLLDKQVKREFGQAPSQQVLKINILREFNTGLYGYRTMDSVFTPIFSLPQTLKVTSSVQDWCGQAFSQINRRKKYFDYELRSYFQSKGDTHTEITNKEVHLEDGIWTKLRIDPSSLPIGEIKIIPSSLSLHLQHTPVKAYQATGQIQLLNDKEIKYFLHYPKLERTVSWVFEQTFPHRINSWKEVDKREKGAITTAKLIKQMQNCNYWEHNKPEQSPLRKKLNLEKSPN